MYVLLWFVECSNLHLWSSMIQWFEGVQLWWTVLLCIISPNTQHADHLFTLMHVLLLLDCKIMFTTTNKDENKQFTSFLARMGEFYSILPYTEIDEEVNPTVRSILNQMDENPSISLLSSKKSEQKLKIINLEKELNKRIKFSKKNLGFCPPVRPLGLETLNLRHFRPNNTCCILDEWITNRKGWAISNHENKEFQTLTRNFKAVAYQMP